MIRRVAVALVRLYQRTIGPLKGETCRFLPTCSEYAIEAIERRGVLAGAALALWRILRCQPLSRGGYDPVPARGWRTRDGEEAEDPGRR